ncbi:MAG: hypothetical protein J6C81_01070 [Muribaculaceae bacterium]|nr:hypothetical protein [Muribaculaceae bacterium]
MDESTIYDKSKQNRQPIEETEIDNINNVMQGQPVPPAFNSAHSKDDTWKKAALGVGGGILLGGVAIGLTSMAKNPDDPTPEPEEEAKPDWLKGDVQVADSVNDNMSFDEAFAAARAEVGPGGAFEWRGGVYGTYTAAEWNNMSAAEKAQWGENFSWGNLHPEEGSLAAGHHSSTTVVEEHHHYHNDPVTASVSRASDHVISGTGGGNDVGIGGIAPEPEVKVLAVVNAENSPHGYNTALLSVDGEDVFLFDIDNDMKFDLMVHDDNHDDHFSRDEFVTLNDDNLTVGNFGGFHISPEFEAQVQQEMGVNENMTAQNTAHEGMDYSRDYDESGFREEDISDSHNDQSDYDDFDGDNNIAKAEIAHAEPSMAEVHGAEPASADVAYHHTEAEVSVSDTEGLVEDYTNTYAETDATASIEEIPGNEPFADDNIDTDLLADNTIDPTNPLDGMDGIDGLDDIDPSLV